MTMTTILHGTVGGWAAIRHIKYDGTATVYGMPYHQISPLVPAGEWFEMVEWCCSTFGPSGTATKPGVWSVDERWYANNARFLFKHKQDLEWFLLRWE